MDVIPIWIRLYNIPNEYWNENTLKVTGNKLGTFVKMDQAVETKDFSIYVWICILWLVAHPLLEMIELIARENV